MGENVITDPVEILEEGRTFYNRLYSDNDNHISNHIQEDISNKFTISEYLPKLSENKKLSCEGALTENELLKSIKAFKNGKTPGTDGLTAEFYKFFWADIKCYLLESHAFNCTTVSGSETPHCKDWKHTSASGGVHKIPWAVVGLAPLIQEAHQCAEDTVQGGSQPYPSGRSLEMGRRQRHTLDAVPCHCLFQV